MPDPLASTAITPRAAPPRRAGWRVAVLGLIGLLALVLPLVQVLNVQVRSLTEDRAERLRLDPLAEALALHRGLAGHEVVATRVLRGRSALEGERRLRKAGVDQNLAALQATLWAGDWPQARREAAALQAGWRELATGIERHTLDVAASQQGHRLLQEQAVQVMDYVSAGLGPTLGGLALATLPRAHWPALVQARQLELAQRIGRAQSARDLAGLALLALASAGIAAAAWARRRAAANDTAGEPGPGTRRGHGRRAGDRPSTAAPATIAAAELQALRRSPHDEPSNR